jgi:hypothetical protein
MRFELSGSLIRPAPLILTYDANVAFDTLAIIELGYTHFEVICIGGAGGHGGGIDTDNTGTTVRSYGGAGGGGGFHRIRGLLSALPDSCPVVVGTGGSAGATQSGNPPNLGTVSDGGDGGASTFNTNTCRASGGKGGKRVQANSVTVSSQANGGEGGIGNRTVAGGGAAGGTAGIPTAGGPGTPGTNGVDGSISNSGVVGKGGGGGAGGVGTYAGVTCNAATSGGRGSYNPSDTLVYGPSDAPDNDLDPPSGTYAVNIVPGGASGAKAAPLNGLPTIYGRSVGFGLTGKGVVVIRLTAE